MLRRIALAASLCVITACASSGGSGPALSVKDEMKLRVEPASKSLFDFSGKVDPNFSDPSMPPSAAEWKKAADDSKIIANAAASMLKAENMVDQGDWKTAASQMADLAAKALAGAQAKDAAKFSGAVNDLGDNCTTCHGKYKNKPAS